MLKKAPILLNNVSLTSFQVVGRKNDWKRVYVSNLAPIIISPKYNLTIKCPKD